MRTLEDVRAELVAQYPQPIKRAKRTPKPKPKQVRGVQPVTPEPEVRRVPFTRYAGKQEMPIAIMRLLEREKVHIICTPEARKYLRNKIIGYNISKGVTPQRYHFRAQTTHEGLLITCLREARREDVLKSSDYYLGSDYAFN